MTTRFLCIALSALALSACGEDSPKVEKGTGSSTECDPETDEDCEEEADPDSGNEEGTGKTDDKPDAKVPPPKPTDAGKTAPPVNTPTDSGPRDAGTPGDGGKIDNGNSGGDGGPSVGLPSNEPCTGKTGMKSGTLRHAASSRDYVVHVPEGLDPNEPVPVVFVVHGFTMNGPQMQRQTGMDAHADRDKFIAIYPTSLLNPWNVGENTCLPGAAVNMPLNDDFKFFEDMVASVEEGQCVNKKAVFVTGFSMGGYFSNNIGCKRGNTFVRAVGPASGGTYTGDCEGAPVPVMLMHGSRDTFIDYNLCGKGARDQWIRRNKCSMEFETKPSGSGTCDWYKDCDPNGQTVFCSYPVAHSWGGADATKEIWSFFKSYI